LRPSTRLLAVLVVVPLILAACSTPGSSESPGGSEPAASVDTLSGDLVISGSSTVKPITSLVAEAFGNLHSGVTYSVDGPGTGDGFALFCNGETDISDASRPIKDEEAANCDSADIHYLGLKIGIDGLSVITSVTNTAVDCLSFLDLYALLGPESQGFTTWAAADLLAANLASSLGTDLGMSHAPYPAADLDVTAPGEESGTFDSFVELAIKKIAETREQEVTTRPDYHASPDDNIIIEGVAGSDTSLGWVGYAYADENRAQVNLLAVDKGDGCVDPTPDTIASGEYPLARDLYIYVNLDKAAVNETLTAFVDYYLSEEGMSAVTLADYIAIDDASLAETRSSWDSR